MKRKLYECKICKLHYEQKELADECFAWCSHHESCNLAVAQKSIEAKNGKMKG